MLPNERRRHLSCYREARDVRNSPASWGIVLCTHLTSYIRRVLRVLGYCHTATHLRHISSQGPDGPHTSSPSRETFEQIRETFLLPTIKAGFKRYNFDSIVGLINYAFMSIFLYLWEKTRLHISLPCH